MEMLARDLQKKKHSGDVYDPGDLLIHWFSHFLHQLLLVKVTEVEENSFFSFPL